MKPLLTGLFLFAFIRPERDGDRLRKRMGFNREVQIGDAGFDAAAAGVLAVLATATRCTRRSTGSARRGCTGT